MTAAGCGGAIVNTSSWLTRGVTAGSAAYSASKGGLDAMIRALALEAGPHGIRINNVNPGIINTPMAQRMGANEETLKPFVRLTPAGRIGGGLTMLATWLPGCAATKPDSSQVRVCWSMAVSPLPDCVKPDACWPDALDLGTF